jgi:protein tyrosine phosphatase (PTP) superfamily phosphohydrolase (DUF442 family)
MNKNKRLAAIGTVALIILIIAIYVAMVCTNETVLVPRPESWAQPIEMGGVPNLYKLSDDLYRSAQPSAEGMTNLEEMGIKTIVNLRLLNSDRDEIEGTDLGYMHINMEAWHAEEEEAGEFQQIVSDPDRVPVLVHCSLGSDRTGTMCAVYRIVVQGWSKEEAIKEMTQGGFGFHQVWANLPMWISALDIDEIKTQAGISQSTPEQDGSRLTCLTGTEQTLSPQTPPTSSEAFLRTDTSSPFGVPRKIQAATGFVEGPALLPDEKSLYYHKREDNLFVIYRVTRP